MPDFRDEHDSMGLVRVPALAYYGAQTQRAVDNFSLSGTGLWPELIRALGLVKWAAADVNRRLGRLESGRRPLTAAQIAALLQAAREIANGQWLDQFPVDVYQTGSGTSTNMNMNEVLSNRAIEIAGGDRMASEKAIHPNDHVNLGQSTNDIFPTAIHVAMATEIRRTLVPALQALHAVLEAKAREWSDVIKIGRTHLADATPLTLGQEFSGFARQAELAVDRAERAIAAVVELPVGGTAVGTGLNTHPDFGGLVSQTLADETGIPFVEARNHFEAHATRDGLVEAHGQLRSIALTLGNIANNIRWLGSGPRCGFFEIGIPDLQPGSSIMPGKVNPVLCESLMQVTARVLGNDATLAFANGCGGQFQLNIMMPVMGQAAVESVRLLAAGTRLFCEKCAAGIVAHPDRCAAAVERSLSLVTSLNPLIGYERAAELAHEAFATDKTIREVCEEQNVLPPAELARALDPRQMLGPQA